MLLITICGKFCSFCKLIMPKFLSQLNYEESKLKSELQIRRQKKKSSIRVKAEPLQFRNHAKLSSNFLTRLTFLYNFWCFPELPFVQ